MSSERERAAMRQAVILSAVGLGTASPNPPVGCVILAPDGRVVGTGFHRRKGEAHAEVNALNAAGTASRGATAVVTLEPCNHVGVTPACRQELIDAGIIRVVIGVIDPTSRGEGGAAALAAAGVEVEVDVLPDECRTVLQPWLTATIRRTPYVAWSYAMHNDRENLDDAAIMRRLRSRFDLIVSGSSIEEGIPAGHSARHFTTGHVDPLQPPNLWLETVYSAGARTVLLVGKGPLPVALLATCAIDEIDLVLPHAQHLDTTAIDPRDLSGFRITNVDAWDGAMLTRLRRM